LSKRSYIDTAEATPCIDVAVIGPGDLAISMGLKGRTDHPDFLVATFEAKIRASGVAWAAPHRRLPGSVPEPQRPSCRSLRVTRGVGAAGTGFRR
jgi:hypothetical protein